MQGWVKVNRCITENWIWEDKPFSKGQAFIDLLLMANHDDNKVLLGNELIEVKRGQKITSIRQLCEKWGWSNKKVVAFLDILEKDKMLERKSDTKKTLITIVNYGKYQDTENEKRHESDTLATDERHESDTKATRKHTNKNDKNVLKNVSNNVNNVNNIYYPNDEKLNEALLEFIEFRKKSKSVMTDKAIELLISRLDKLTTDNDEKIEILNQSIMNSWKGVFPLNNKKQGKQTFDEFVDIGKGWLNERERISSDSFGN